MSLRAYQTAAQQAEEPRSVEYRLFAEVPRALMTAAQLAPPEIGGRRAARAGHRRRCLA